MLAFRRSLVVVGVVSLASLTLNVLPNPWAGWPPDPCQTQDCFCEPFQNRWVLQPLVAYSNLAYVLVGALILSAGHMHSAPLYGAMTIGVGVGSFFYHASLTRLGEWLDLMGMYALTGWLLLYNLTRWRALSSGVVSAVYLGLLVVLGAGLVWANAWQQVYMALLVVGALVLEGLVLAQRRPLMEWRYLLGGLACFGVGALFWAFSAPGEWCGRLGPIPPHVLWHSLSAAAAGLMFLYYRSEKERLETGHFA